MTSDLSFWASALLTLSVSGSIPLGGDSVENFEVEFWLDNWLEINYIEKSEEK